MEKKQQEIMDRNNKLAKQIALLLVESKARVDDINYIFADARSMLSVGSVEAFPR